MCKYLLPGFEAMHADGVVPSGAMGLQSGVFAEPEDLTGLFPPITPLTTGSAA